MTRDDDRALKASGLNARELAYLFTQPGIDAPGAEWTPLAAAQVVLYGTVRHMVEDRGAFAACRYIAVIVHTAKGNLDVLGGMYLVVRGTTPAFIHNPTEVPSGDAVVELDDVLDAVREVMA